MEQVWAVPRASLFRKHAFSGFLPAGKHDYLASIRSEGSFVSRDAAETDPSLKQVIPYALFTHGKKVFLYERLAGERRLVRKRSLGIGGHINPGDAEKGDLLSAALLREFSEEMQYPHPFETKLLGYLNDEGDEVGAVHFGVVYLLAGSRPEIAAREVSSLRGELVPLSVLSGATLEGWSALCLGALREALE